MNTDSKVLTLSDPEFGLAVTVTAISKGYAVTFIDTDAEEIIATKIYPDKLRAMSYAYGLVGANASTSLQ